MSMPAENADQREYWNSPTAGKWLDHESLLDRLFAGLTDEIVRCADLAPGMDAVDVGCGTGALSLAVAYAVSPGTVTGIDVSRPLLARARERAGARGEDEARTHTRFIEADAQTHPLPDRHDRVVSRLGVMFFADPVAAFANIRGWLAPRGAGVFAAWGPFERNPFFAVPRRLAEARLGAVPMPEPRAPGPMALGEAAYARDVLTRSGWTNAEVRDVAMPLRYDGSLAAFARLAATVGPVATVMREREGTDTDLDAIAEEIAEAFKTCVMPGGIEIPACFNIMTADR